jgi:hypothetical protein
MVKTPLKLMTKSLLTPAFFLSLLVISYLILILVIFPVVVPAKGPSWFIVDTIAFACTLVCFCAATFRNPGYLEKPKGISFLVRILIIN